MSWWQNVKMTKCQAGKMPRWQNVKMSKCQDDKMSRWQNVKMTKCQDDKMPKDPKTLFAQGSSKVWNQGTLTEGTQYSRPPCTN
jgi:hypothetical protein